MAKRRIMLAAAFFAAVVAWPVGRWDRQTRPWETLTHRVHRLCDKCGLDDDEIDRLMDEIGDPALSREQALALFFDTFENPALASRACRVRKRWWMQWIVLSGRDPTSRLGFRQYHVAGDILRLQVGPLVSSARNLL